MEQNYASNSVFNSIRYVLSSKMMNEYFIQYTSLPQTKSFIDNIIKSIKNNDTASIKENMPSVTFKPDKSKMSIAPKTPKGDSKDYNTVNNINPSISQEIKKRGEKIDVNPLSVSAHVKESRSRDINTTNSTDKILNVSKKRDINLENPDSLLNKITTIPRFYDKNNLIPDDLREDTIISFNKLPDKIDLKSLSLVLDSLFELNPMFTKAIFNKIYDYINKIDPSNPLEAIKNENIVDNSLSKHIAKKDFITVYNNFFQGRSRHKRAFNAIKCLDHREKNPTNFIYQKDFYPFMKCLLEEHEGLKFLVDYPDFQVKYSETVAMRFFYTNDINCDNKLSYREFNQSNINSILNTVCTEPDINKIRDYFSYEHFYVLYCKFWELDGKEHQFLIDKEGFSKYESHCLNTKAVERIFLQIPRKFCSGSKDKMNFEDFLCKFTIYLI